MKIYFYISMLVIFYSCHQNGDKVKPENFEQYEIINKVFNQVIDTTSLYYEFISDIKFYPPGSKEYKKMNNEIKIHKKAKELSKKEYFQKYFRIIDKPILLQCNTKTDIYFHNSLQHFDEWNSDPEVKELFTKFDKLTNKEKRIDISRLFYSPKVKIIKYRKEKPEIENYYYKGYISFSDIIINEKKDLAIFYFCYVCGPECAFGNVFLIRKINNNWSIVKSRNLWVS